jgi:hypothetical protein
MGVAFGGQVYDVVGAHFASLREFPPRQKGGTLMGPMRQEDAR